MLQASTCRLRQQYAAHVWRNVCMCCPLRSALGSDRLPGPPTTRKRRLKRRTGLRIRTAQRRHRICSPRIKSTAATITTVTAQNPDISCRSVLRRLLLSKFYGKMLALHWRMLLPPGAAVFTYLRIHTTLAQYTCTVIYVPHIYSMYIYIFIRQHV